MGSDRLYLALIACTCTFRSASGFSAIKTYQSEVKLKVSSMAISSIKIKFRIVPSREYRT